MTPSTAVPRRSFAALLPALLVFGCLTWSFGNTLAELEQAWRTNDQYSHGYLVPAFALFLLWLRRERLDREAVRPGLILGGLLLALGLGMRLVGAYWYFLWLDTISIVPCVAGACWLLGGWAAWRWAWPSVLYLAFMIPLPFRLATAMSAPLQTLATVSSTFIMQAIGLPALSEGNVITLNEAKLNVVEACSGLRMLVVFVALSTAMALVTRRPWVDRLILLVSAIPIAVVSNILRITATGILYETTTSETANAFFHDLGGWLMMPLALVFLAVELKLLSHLFLEAPPAPPRPVRDPSLRRLRRTQPVTRARQPRPAPAPPRPPERPPVTAERGTERA